MINSISVQQFLELARNNPVIDVRAPLEFNNGHVPSAHNIPLFSDDERAVIGTIYKQQGKNEAIRVGLEFVGPQLTGYIEQTKKIIETVSYLPRSNPSIHLPVVGTQDERLLKDVSSLVVSVLSDSEECIEPFERHPQNQNVLVYCARGGMRSKSFGMLLATCGYTVYQLQGGYKAFKKYLRETAAQPHTFVVLGGKTGCGKTNLLRALKKRGEQVLDLEALANHKGSVFGALGEQPQPPQETFMVNCCCELMHYERNKIIWIEKESYKIGNLTIPHEIWHQMQDAPVLYVDIPQQQRIQNLMRDYGSWDRELIKSSIQRLNKKIGGARVKELCAKIDVGNLEDVARSLLDYYDQLYEYSLQKNIHHNIVHLYFEHETVAEQAEKLIACALQVHN